MTWWVTPGNGPPHPFQDHNQCMYCVVLPGLTQLMVRLITRLVWQLGNKVLFLKWRYVGRSRERQAADWLLCDLFPPGWETLLIQPLITWASGVLPVMDRQKEGKRAKQNCSKSSEVKLLLESDSSVSQSHRQFRSCSHWILLCWRYWLTKGTSKVANT